MTVPRRKKGVPLPPPAPICLGVWIGSEITDDVKEFVMAMDRYKREAGRPFPTWSEALQVAKSLGYRKVE